jgi:hypothetical protein
LAANKHILFTGYTKIDPAIERWNQMREGAYKHFRFTPRTTLFALWGFCIVPGTILYVSALTDSRWNLSAKLKGQSLHAVTQDIGGAESD